MQSTYENEAHIYVDGDWFLADVIRFRCQVSWLPGSPAQLYGPAEDCYPEEPAEYDGISDVEIEVQTRKPGAFRYESKWVDCPDWLLPHITRFVEERADDIVADLAEDEAGMVDDARDRRNEYAREIFESITATNRVMAEAARKSGGL